MKLSVLLKVAMLASLATILMNFQFSLFVPYLQYDASEVPALICGFAISPLAGAAVVVLKNLIYLFTHFKPHELIGIPINTVAGLVYVLVACGIYHQRKTRDGAIVSLFLGVLAMCLVMIPVGLVLQPVFQRWFLPDQAVIKADDLVQLLLVVVLPFNICKGAITGILTFLTYKRCSRVLKSQNLWDD